MGEVPDIAMGMLVKFHILLPHGNEEAEWRILRATGRKFDISDVERTIARRGCPSQDHRVRRPVSPPFRRLSLCMDVYAPLKSGR